MISGLTEKNIYGAELEEIHEQADMIQTFKIMDSVTSTQQHGLERSTTTQ